MRIERSFGLVALTIVIVFLSFPMGFAAYTHSHVAGPVQSKVPAPMYEMFAASNPTGSCASLGLKTGAIGAVQLTHGGVYVSVQKAQPNGVFNVTIIKLGNGESDKSWVCGATSTNVGSISVDQTGTGQFSQSFKASSGQKYVVELLDSKGNVLYSTYSISM